MLEIFHSKPRISRKSLIIEFQIHSVVNFIWSNQSTTIKWSNDIKISDGNKILLAKINSLANQFNPAVFGWENAKFKVIFRYITRKDHRTRYIKSLSSYSLQVWCGPCIWCTTSSEWFSPRRSLSGQLSTSSDPPQCRWGCTWCAPSCPVCHYMWSLSSLPTLLPELITVVLMTATTNCRWERNHSHFVD